MKLKKQNIDEWYNSIYTLTKHDLEANRNLAELIAIIINQVKIMAVWRIVFSKVPGLLKNFSDIMFTLTY